MLILLALLLGSLVLTTIFWTFVATASYKTPDAIVFTSGILGLVTGIAALFFGIMMIVIPVSRSVGQHTCSNWSQQSGGIPTKFVLLNWADTGTCLAKTPDGRWVVNSNWYAYVGANK